MVAVLELVCIVIVFPSPFECPLQERAAWTTPLIKRSHSDDTAVTRDSSTEEAQRSKSSNDSRGSTTQEAQRFKKSGKSRVHWTVPPQKKESQWRACLLLTHRCKPEDEGSDSFDAKQTVQLSKNGSIEKKTKTMFFFCV